MAFKSKTKKTSGKAIKPKMPDSNSSIESLLLTVALEVRLKIYEYALDTGTVDLITESRVYIIKERTTPPTRAVLHETRQNDYCLINITSKSFALEQTCAQIRDEIHHYIPKAVFKFTSTKALVRLLDYHPWDARRTINEHNQITLQAASRVVVSTKEDARIPFRMRPLFIWVRHDLIHMTDSIIHPFNVTFVDEEDDSSQQLIEATKMWEEGLKKI